jgi:aminoglycoside phosphotransferase (APT) family kinase protein
MLSAADGPLVAELFGLGADAVLTGPIAAGWMGRVWRLETDRGAYAVKEPFFEVSPTEVEDEADYQDAVHAAGVPMPAVLRTPSGEALATVDGQPVRVYEFVDVLERDRRVDAAAVGRLLARIHGVVVPSGPVDGWYSEPVGAGKWSDLVRRSREAEAPFAERLAGLVPDLLAVEAVLERPTYAQLCHRDLWADNVRPAPGGGLIVLDWENSGPGDPSQELGVALFEFGCREPARIRTLYDAYVAAGGPGRITRFADLTMLVAQIGHIGQQACERWLAPNPGENRADLAEWVSEFVDDPVTLATLEEILAALA